MFPPVFVISLTTSDRREKLTAHLNDLNIPFTFFDAVNGRGCDVNTIDVYHGAKRRAYFGRDMTGGEVGCSLSHKAIAQKMVAEKIPHAIVFEDDVVLQPDFKKVVQNLMQNPYPWECVRFLGSSKVANLRQRTVATLNAPYRLTRLSTCPAGAHAYVMNLSGAQKMLSAISYFYLPVDMIMARPWISGFSALTVQPGLANQDLNFESSIGTVRDSKKPIHLSGWRRTIYPLTKGWFKLSDTILKRVYYWGSLLTGG